MCSVVIIVLISQRYAKRRYVLPRASGYAEQQAAFAALKNLQDFSKTEMLGEEAAFGAALASLARARRSSRCPSTVV